jgi:hypothetical protein
MAKLDALLMPSAVAPSADTPFQALVDPKIRLHQTVKAISYWTKLAEKNDFEVLVADNTGFGVKILEMLPKSTLKSKVLRVIDVPAISKEDIIRGKGAGETSTLIAGLEYLQLSDKAIVAKVNARYIATNGLFLIDEIENHFDFAAWPRPQLDSVDTTFFAGNVGFLREAFQFVYEETDDLRERFVENLYAQVSIRNLSCKYVRFNYSPAIKGQSGTTGSKASPFNEFRTVSVVVRFRKSIRKFFTFIKPGYQRGLR